MSTTAAPLPFRQPYITERPINFLLLVISICCCLATRADGMSTHLHPRALEIELQGIDRLAPRQPLPAESSAASSSFVSATSDGEIVPKPGSPVPQSRHESSEHDLQTDELHRQPSERLNARSSLEVRRFAVRATNAPTNLTVR